MYIGRIVMNGRNEGMNELMVMNISYMELGLFGYLM